MSSGRAAGFEWFVAWRYLRESGRRGRRLLAAALAAGLLAAVAWAAARVFGRPVLDDLGLGRPPIGRYAMGSATGLAAFSALGLLLAALLRRFSVFTSVSIFGVFLGTAALVIVLSVMSGFEGDLRSKILGTHAHAVVRAPVGPLPDPARVLRLASESDDVLAAQRVVESEVMIIGAGNEQVVLLRGIDPDRAAAVTDLERYLHGDCAAGKLEHLKHPEALAKRSAADRDASAGGGRVLPGLLVGCELAKNLRLYVGDEARVASPSGGLGPMGPMPRTKAFRVAGIFYSGMYEYDAKIAYAAIGPAQSLLGLGGSVHAVELKVRDPDRAREVVAALGARLGPGYEVKDWAELNRSLFEALTLEKVAMFVVLTFIVLVASFSIVTNLLMVVLQKGREIAILKAMGARAGDLLRVFVIQGVYIGTIGTALGIAAGVAVCAALERHGLRLDPEVYYISTLPVDLDPAEVAAVAVAAVAISVVATAYPAWLASRYQPIEGLRYE